MALFSCQPEEKFSIPEPPESIQLSETFFYQINLNDRSGDTFKVRLYVGDLTSDNAIFQFPATVPGTYDIMNIGRFVREFTAYDKQFNRISSSQISVNQWQIDNPEDVYVIEYEIAETWDTPVTEYELYRMAGTSLEDDHALLNTFCVLGYPEGLKDKPFTIGIDHPSGWTIGTSLVKTSDGYFWAANYDLLVDSPLLLGTISSESTEVSSATINVHTFSEHQIVSASQIMPDVEQAILDANEFLDGLPVDRYSFLFHYGESSAGALEHSYSSVYVLEESQYYSGSLDWVIYHEFFHIVTPLNIHSEIIEDFNFVTPTPSEHLWLYEGVTEWASDMMQFRNGSMDSNELFRQFSRKLEVDRNYYDLDYSLSDIGLNAYTEYGHTQFGNIYNRAAIVAALLDIRLLELSSGAYGLRELILELANEYGPEKSFPEDGFFDILVNMTYPEISDFINSYIINAEPLPVEEYFSKIGVIYNDADYSFTINSSAGEAEQALFQRWSINF